MKKEDLPKNGAPISVGSKVMCVDGSYSLSIAKDSFILEHIYLGLSEEIFTVVAVNVPCPTDLKGTESLGHQNSCIIKDQSGGVHFVSAINIRNVKKLF
jgi:hypothetical protein